MEDNYYFFDTSGYFWVFRREQHTNEKGELFWDILNKITKGRASFGYSHFIASHFLKYEIIQGLISKNQTSETLLNITKFLAEFESFIKIEVTKGVLEKSCILMEKHDNLKSYDAIHLACALEAKNTYKNIIFITDDENQKNVAIDEGLKVNEV